MKKKQPFLLLEIQDKNLAIMEYSEEVFASIRKFVLVLVIILILAVLSGL